MTNSMTEPGRTTSPEVVLMDDVLITNIHRLAGWLDGCLDTLGHTDVHAQDWLDEFVEAHRG